MKQPGPDEVATFDGNLEKKYHLLIYPYSKRRSAQHLHHPKKHVHLNKKKYMMYDSESRQYQLFWLRKYSDVLAIKGDVNWWIDL